MHEKSWAFEIWVTLGLCAFYLALMPATQLWDWDESLYGRTGIEMWRMGDLLVPRFNGTLFPDKPPLGYWLMGLSARLLGESEVGIRLFSAPAMALAGLTLNLTARRLVGLVVARRAQVIFGTSMMAVYLGAAAMMDAYLALAMGLSVWALVAMLDAPGAGPGRHLGWLALLFVGLTMGWLIKGPVVPALAGGTGLLALILLRKGERPNALLAGAVIVVWLAALGAFLLWLIPADRATGGALLEKGFGIHVLGRALQPMEGHGGSGSLGSYLANLPYYLPVILIAFSPWSFALPGLGRALSGAGLGGRRARMIVLAWALPVLAVFTLVATKLPHYIFPAFAPLSIVVAWLLETGALTRRARAWGAGLVSLVYLLLAGLAGLGLVTLKAWPLALAALVMAAIGLGVWPATRRREARFAFLTLAALVGTAVIYWAGLRPFDAQIKLSRPVAELIRAELPADTPVFMAGYTEPSLIFYLSRPPGTRVVTLTPETAAAALEGVKAGVLVVTEATWQALAPVLSGALAGAQPRELGRFRARNYNAGAGYQTVLVMTW